MASVYRAVGVDRINRGKVVAIKVPAPNLLTDSFIDRFVAEIQTSQRLSLGRHPAIVETINYEVFEEPHGRQELYGLVMEFIEGQSLGQYLARRQIENQPLQPAEISSLLTPICDALEYAHTSKPSVLHRDIKPHNIMMTADGKTKLMDFGIARILDGGDGLTRGGIVGTPAYMPPELFTIGTAIDERVDIYMMGNLLQELLTFSPFGDLDESLGHPTAWINLIDDATSKIRGNGPPRSRRFEKDWWHRSRHFSRSQRSRFLWRILLPKERNPWKRECSWCRRAEAATIARSAKPSPRPLPERKSAFAPVSIRKPSFSNEI